MVFARKYQCDCGGHRIRLTDWDGELCAACDDCNMVYQEPLPYLLEQARQYIYWLEIRAEVATWNL